MIDSKIVRFIRLIRLVDDTPTLIRRIAEDKDYLKFCTVVVKNSQRRNAPSSQVLLRLKKEMRKSGLPFEKIRTKLLPVAVSLGLESGDAGSNHIHDDNYRILGLSPEVTQTEIRKAFRIKARETHPDIKSGSEELFLKIQNAYRILSDDSLRQQYDLVRNRNRNIWQWVEKAGSQTIFEGADPARKMRHRYGFYLTALILLLIGLIFFVDTVNQEISLGNFGVVKSRGR